MRASADGAVAPLIATSRLRLRPLGEGDAALYCRLYTDPGLMRHIAAPLTQAAAERSFRTAYRLESGSPFPLRWIIQSHDTGIDIGLLGLTRHPGPGDEIELGMLLLAEWQGQGRAVETITAALGWLFGDIGLQRIWTRQHPDNPAAYRLMRALGFTGVVVPDQAAGSELRWEMTRTRWRAGPHAGVVFASDAPAR